MRTVTIMSKAYNVEYTSISNKHVAFEAVSIIADGTSYTKTTYTKGKQLGVAYIRNDGYSSAYMDHKNDAVFIRALNGL